MWLAAGSMLSAEPDGVDFNGRVGNGVQRPGGCHAHGTGFASTRELFPFIQQSSRKHYRPIGARLPEKLPVQKLWMSLLKRPFLDTIPEERIRTLQSKVQELQTETNELSDRLSILGTEREFILQIKAQTADNINKDLKVQRPTIEDWQKVLAFFDSNLNKNFAEQRKIVKDRADIQNKIDALQKQINQISPRSRRIGEKYRCGGSGCKGRRSAPLLNIYSRRCSLVSAVRRARVDGIAGR